MNACLQLERSQQPLRHKTSVSGRHRRHHQIKAFSLTNQELLENLGFINSEQDLAYPCIIWGTAGYWVRTDAGQVTICCNHNDNLRVWTMSEVSLLSHAYKPEGFDLDRAPCNFKGIMARMDLIDRFV